MRNKSDPVRLAQSVQRCGSQSEGPGFKSRRRRLDSSVRQTTNGPCLSRLSCINEYKVFLRCLSIYGTGITSVNIRWCNGASPEVLRKKHLFPKGLLKKKKKKKTINITHRLSIIVLVQLTPGEQLIGYDKDSLLFNNHSSSIELQMSIKAGRETIAHSILSNF